MKSIATNQITPHPLLARMPMMGAEELEALKCDIAARGIEYPIHVCDLDGDVVAVDGRHRLKVAQDLGLKTVAVEFREADQAADIIIGQIVHRRHYPKGVIAYLVFPLLPTPRNGGDRRSESIQSTLISTDGICKRYGFTRDLYFQAKGVHEVFRDDPSLRDLYEPLLLSGEIGLGRLHAGLKGAKATKGKKKVVKAPEVLLGQAVEQLEFRWDYWDKMGEAQRRETAERVAEAILKAPEEVRLMVALRLGKKGGKR